MTFQQAVVSALRQYAGFGRARRSEFWWFVLFYVLVSVVAGLIDQALRTGLVGALVTIGFFLPNLAVQIRRLHDIDKSGWWMFIGLIPLAGIVILIVWWCREGVPGDNRFGPDPKCARLDPRVFDESAPPTLRA